MTNSDAAVEIGYLCAKGHFIFHDDPDGDDSCGSKRMAGVVVVPKKDVVLGRFTESLDEARADFGSALGRAYS